MGVWLKTRAYYIKKLLSIPWTHSSESTKRLLARAPSLSDTRIFRQHRSQATMEANNKKKKELFLLPVVQSFLWHVRIFASHMHIHRIKITTADDDSAAAAAATFIHSSACSPAILFPYIAPSSYTHRSQHTLSLGARLHFVCVRCLVGWCTPPKRSNFPNAWLWILLILSEQVHQFAIHIIVLCVGKVCTQEIPKYNIWNGGAVDVDVVAIVAAANVAAPHSTQKMMCEAMRLTIEYERPGQASNTSNKRKWTNPSVCTMRGFCEHFTHLDLINPT